MNYNILNLIFEYVSIKKLIKLEIICKLWKNIINDNKMYNLQKKTKYLIHNIQNNQSLYDYMVPYIKMVPNSKTRDGYGDYDYGTTEFFGYPYEEAFMYSTFSDNMFKLKNIHYMQECLIYRFIIYPYVIHKKMNISIDSISIRKSQYGDIEPNYKQIFYYDSFEVIIKFTIIDEKYRKMKIINRYGLPQKYYLNEDDQYGKILHNAKNSNNFENVLYYYINNNAIYELNDNTIYELVYHIQINKYLAQINNHGSFKVYQYMNNKEFLDWRIKNGSIQIIVNKEIVGMGVLDWYIKNG